MGDPEVQCGTSEISCRVQEHSSKRVISELSPEGLIGFKELKTRIPDREHTMLRGPAQGRPSTEEQWQQVAIGCTQDEGFSKRHSWRHTHSSDHE